MLVSRKLPLYVPRSNCSAPTVLSGLQRYRYCKNFGIKLLANLAQNCLKFLIDASRLSLTTGIICLATFTIEETYADWSPTLSTLAHDILAIWERWGSQALSNSCTSSWIQLVITPIYIFCSPAKLIRFAKSGSTFSFSLPSSCPVVSKTKWKNLALDVFYIKWD